VTARATRSALVRHWWAARGIIVSRLMRVRFGPVHLAHDLPRGHSRAMLPSERNALVNEVNAALTASAEPPALEPTRPLEAVRVRAPD
jgi:16S rRNA U516 pseudouridylate synthase RsuA-like enzyme